MSSGGHVNALAACGCSLPQSQEQVRSLSGPVHSPETRRGSNIEGGSLLEPVDAGVLATVSAWRQRGSVEGRKVSGSSSGDRKAGRASLATPPWWETEQFDLWLEQRLAEDRAATVARVQECAGRRLARHHESLSQELQDRLIVELGRSGGGLAPAVGGCACGPSSTPSPSNGAVTFAVPAAVSESQGTEAEDQDSQSRALTAPAAPGLPAAIAKVKSTYALLVNERATEKSTTDRDAVVAKVTQQLSEAKAASEARAVQFEDRTIPCPSGNSGGPKPKHYKSRHIAALAAHTKSVLWHRHDNLVTRIVSNRNFEIVVSVLIVLNCAVMAAEVQYVGCYVGSTLQHSDCIGFSEHNMPGLRTLFAIFAALFSLLFLGEFVLRMCYLRTNALFSGWMWFDLILLVFGILDTVGRFIDAFEIVDVNPSMMRTARLARLVRVVKVLKLTEIFDTLFVLLKSILATRQTLAWSVMIMFLTMSAVGMIINQLIDGYLLDSAIDEGERREVYELFGTYTRMITTMAELTLGNWAPPMRLLMVKVSQWWGVFVVIYRCVFCLALVNVTSAVFIAETQRVATDDEVQVLHKRRNDKRNARVLTELFEELDESQDGWVNVEEMAVLLHDDGMKNLLSLMDLEVKDVSELLNMMSEGDRQVDKDQFIKGIMSLKGDAKSSGQTKILLIVQEIEETVERLYKMMVPATKRERRPSVSSVQTSRMG